MISTPFRIRRLVWFLEVLLQLDGMHMNIFLIVNWALKLSSKPRPFIVRSLSWYFVKKTCLLFVPCNRGANYFGSWLLFFGYLVGFTSLRVYCRGLSNSTQIITFPSKFVMWHAYIRQDSLTSRLEITFQYI